jgi:hypothetical protein
MYIEFGPRRILYDLHREERKRLRIVIAPELTVDVFAPLAAGDEEIHAALEKKAAWIASKLDQLEAFHPLPAPKQYISGETLMYLGRQYRLKIEHGPRQSAKLLGRYLWVWIEDKKDTRSIMRAVYAWYQKRAHETLGRYMETCFAIASRHGVPEPHFTIRTMLRRWGSCSPKGRITLNSNLVKVPVHCIEYVMMHELCHLKYPNHSKAFYSLLTRCQPDWRRRKEILDKVVI